MAVAAVPHGNEAHVGPFNCVFIELIPHRFTGFAEIGVLFEHEGKHKGIQTRRILGNQVETGHETIERTGNHQIRHFGIAPQLSIGVDLRLNSAVGVILDQILEHHGRYMQGRVIGRHVSVTDPDVVHLRRGLASLPPRP